MKRQDAISALLFLPAMGLLALAVFGVFWVIIKGGNAAVYAWHWIFRELGLPFPAAMALTVIFAALTVYAAFYWLGKRRQLRRNRKL